jgi:NADH dehydrogenase
LPENTSSKPDSAKKKIQIVIVGGGAGGLALATKLGARYGRKNHDIILVDRNRTHIWKPLLHEVAAGSLDANLDEVGYRGHCYRWGYRFFFGTLETVDRERREIVIAPLQDDDGSEIVSRHRIRYDYLILAIGSETNDFGTPGAREYCMFLDSRADADRFRNRLLNHCLRVSRAMVTDPANEQFVRVAIVGAGATGVELAAELYNAAEALRFYGLEVFDEKRLKVTIVEAAPRILSALGERLAAAAKHELEKLGVSVRTSTKVASVEANALVTATGERIEADIIVWVAGVKAPATLATIEGLETNRSGQLVVRPSLQTTNDERIFAIGDCCACRLPGSERPVPPRAQAAHQMAETAAENLRNLMEGKPLHDYVYRDRGSLVSLSRYSTVGNLMGNLVGGQLAVEGRIARVIYQSLYRMHLISIHGWIKGLVLIGVSIVNRVVRPRLKLH